MTRSFFATVVILLALVGCGEREAAVAPPAPFELSAAAIGNYCGMNVLEHPGPKGQIILESRLEPVWFSSARDVFAFTLLPEEPKDIRAIYVSDMAKTDNWESPGPDNWVEARSAFFVIGSSKTGGMGAPETVPFSTEHAARKFADQHGGLVRRFEEVPHDYILGSGSSGSPENGAAPPHNH